VLVAAMTVVIAQMTPPWAQSILLALVAFYGTFAMAIWQVVERGE
jgi:hypothetical protein